MYAKAKYRKDYQTPDFTVTDIYLDFQLEPEKTVVVATSQYQRLNKESTTLRLDGHDFQFSSIKLNGKPFSQYQQDSESLTLDLARVEADQFELEITTILSPAANTSLQGLYQSGEAFCTQCEVEGFRQITYMLDRPDVLARYTTKITADKAKYPFLLSNGNRINSGDLEDGRHWVEWNDPFPKPSYLFALVAGDFDVLKDQFITKSGREVALELYVNRGNLDRADWAMQSLKRAMKWDEERFDLEYDLDIYMIVAVDFFNMGAMENKGLNIFNDKYVLANPQTATDDDYLAIESVIAHEYFHNWTGNRVTCRDWFQLSLKEGLTVFRDQEFSSDTGSRPVNRINNVKFLRTVQFAEDAGPMAHPIRPEKVNLHIPLKIALYDEKGAAQTLYDADGVVDNVLNITQKDQTFEFHNIYTKPVPALLCDFSAPVKLDYDYSTSQLITLLKFAENGFIRWDATQMLLAAELRRNVTSYQQGQPLDLSAETAAVLYQVLDNYQKDIELTSLILTLPKATEFAELFKTIDPDAISAVREFMAQTIADNLKELLLKTYNQIRLDEYQINRQDIALRKLRNVCLSYLAYSNIGNNLVNKHYTYSNNMTDTLAALTSATQAKLACRDSLLADFEQKWQHDGLVMDKWFALQATRPEDNVLQNVMQLMDHPSFNFNNPNRVRSLIGAFAGQNLKAFHAIDGSGYRFLTDILIKLNKSNPQVASRLIEPLIRFARYDAQRQTLMKRALERISETEDLSRDLFEKIEKALQ